METEEIIAWAMVAPNYILNESYWKDRIHYDQNDNIHCFKDIDDNYLKNIINYFKNTCDISPLLKEAKKRKLKIN